MTTTEINCIIYSRFSSDLQTDKSIEDQERLCVERAKREGWRVIEKYADRAISGANMLRPDIQKLLQDIRARRCQVILSESLDRLSRDQEDVAHIYKRSKHAGIKIITLSEGEINELHIGLKGTMGALYLKDLAQKTHRGLQGVALEGKCAGGKTYGYDTVIKHDARGERIRGDRTINETEAAIVRRIFSDYIGGKSPKRIAFELNQEAISSPRGGDWGQSTINGNRKRGTGILNNELYIGRNIWNRQQFSKDPDSGKRGAIPRPADEIVIVEVPELRILEQEIWDRAKSLQKGLEHKKGEFWKSQRPKSLFSHLIKCAQCGGGYSKISAAHIGCSTARNKGTCDNRLSMKASELEERVLGALRGRLMNDELCQEFCKEYMAHANRMRMEHNASLAGYEAELVRNKREIDKLIDALASGVNPLEVKDRINFLSDRQRDLRELTATTERAPTLIHPSMALRYHAAIKELMATLNDPAHRAESAQIIRTMIDKIVLTPCPDTGKLTVDLHGDLAGILQVSMGAQNGTAPDKKSGAAKHNAQRLTSNQELAALGQQVKLVAGTCNHLNLRRFSKDYSLLTDMATASCSGLFRSAA